MRREKITMLDRFILESIDEKDELAGIYSDVYKEKYGIRPRWMNFEQMSVEDLRAELERLYGEEGRIDYEEEMSEPERDPMADFMVPTDQDFHPYETLPSRQGMGKRAKFMEASLPQDFNKAIIRQLDFNEKPYSFPGSARDGGDVSPNYAGCDSPSDDPEDYLPPGEWWIGELKTSFPHSRGKKIAQSGWYVVHFGPLDDGEIESGPHPSRNEAMQIASSNAADPYLSEAVVDMGDFKKKKNVKTYEGIIGKFVATSQSGVENLQFCKEFLDPEEQGVFDELLKTYRRSASDLSAFLRAKRLRMMK